MKQIYLAYSNAAKLSDISTTKGFLKAKANVVEWTSDIFKNSQNLKNSDYLFIIADPYNKDRFGRGLYEIAMEYVKLHGGVTENVYVYIDRSQSNGSISNISLARLRDLSIDNPRDWKRYAKYEINDTRTSFTSLMNNDNSIKYPEIMSSVSFKLKDWLYTRDTKVGAYRTIDGYRITYLGDSRIDSMKQFSITYELGTVMNEGVIRKLLRHWRFDQAWGCPNLGREGDIEIIKNLEQDIPSKAIKQDVECFSDMLYMQKETVKEKVEVQESTSSLLLLG